MHRDIDSIILVLKLVIGFWIFVLLVGIYIELM
jgi:hypothetical protein